IQSSDLTTVLLGTNNAQIVRLLIEKYPQTMDLGENLVLLKSKDPGVKAAVIDPIETNNILARKIVCEVHERKTYQALRTKYCKKFELLRERHGDKCAE